MITEKSNRLQVIVITDYDYPISAALCDCGISWSYSLAYFEMELKNYKVTRFV